MDRPLPLRACWKNCFCRYGTSRHLGRCLDLEGATELFYSALYDSKTSEFKEFVLKLFDYEVSDINLLILDRLEILPEYRGGGLGLACLYRCMQQHQEQKSWR